MDSFYTKMVNIVGKDCVFCDENMGKHTTFKAGGKAKYFVEPSTKEEISALIKLFRNEEREYYIIGNGSNLLVKDTRYQGVLIKIGNRMSDIFANGNRIECQSGALMASVSNNAAKESLSGLEFAAGIPGTIGGAVTMNAGAYGGEMKDVVTKVTVADEEGNIFNLSKENLQFGYRTSAIQQKHYIVLSAELLLNRERNHMQIKEKMDQYMNARREKQPLEFPSAGSTFKRPAGYFAGKLIMDSNLAGYQIGGARVSEKHCGFIINVGGATADDILNLIRYVQKTVKDRFDVELETEVKILG